MKDNNKRETRVVDVPAAEAMTLLTDRKRVEDLLREAKARTESVLASVADGHLLLDRQWRYLYVNEAAVRAIGRPREQILSRTFWELYPDLLGTELDRQYRRAMDERVPVSFDFHHSPTNIWWENRCFPADEGLAVFATDITARKQTDEKLRQYEKAVEGLEEMIVVVDREYRYLIANRAFLNYRDVKRDQLIGHLVSEFVDHATFERVRQKLDECFQGRVVRFELRNSYPNVGERDLFLSFFPIEGARGVDRAACIGRDITEQKRAEKALRKAEKKYRVIFENAGEGIFQSTPEGQYIEANPALARMHGFDLPEDLICTLKDISHEVYVDPTRREEFKDLIEAQGFVRGFENRIFRRDGSKIWISVNARAVRDEQGKILYYEGTTQDINERKLAEARSAAFATLARKLSGATTPLEAGRIIAETASELFGWDACNLDLYDADNDQVHPILNVDTIAGRRVDMTASCVSRKPTVRARRVMDHGSELLLREQPISFDQDAIPFGDKMRPSASIMTVPVRHASKIVGMLSIQSYTPRAYDAAALSDLQSLAEHCGEALNRIHAEQSFYESEERFRQMAEHFEDVVWFSDQDIRNILYVNPAYEKVFRRTCESLYERLESFLDAVHSEDRARVERVVESQKKGDHAPVEYRIVRPDGSVRWILQRSFPMRNTQGEVNLVAGIAQDITDRKRTDEALRESEERYRDLVENSREFICTHDLDGLILSANRAAAEVLGYDPKEFEGRKSFRDLLVPEVRHQFDDYLARIRRDGFANGLVLVQTRAGERRLLEYHNTLRTEGVVTPIVRGMANDITERKRAEDALRESEHFRRTIVESEPECVKLVAPDYTLLDMNPAGLAMIGAVSREQVVGLSVLSLIAPEWRETFKAMHERVCRGDSVSAEFEIVGLTGVRRWMETHAAPLRNKESKVIAQLAITLDITERKRADESVKLFRNLIDQSSDAIEVIDPVTLRFVDCNESAHRCLGYSREEFLSLTVFDIDPLVTPSSIVQFDEEMRESGSTTLESVHRRKDGTTFPVEVNVKLVELERVYRLAVVRDITGRKRAEEALRESEARYRDLVENSREFICTHDLDGLILSANRAAVEVLGYDPEDYYGKKSFREILAPEMRPQFDDYLARIRRDGIASGLALVQTSSGECRIWEYYNTLRTEGVANPIVRGMARDITERRQAEAALKISERKYRDIVSFAPVGIYQSLHDGTLITANQALAKMLGCPSVEELLKLKLDIDIYLVAGEHQNLIAECEHSGKVIDLEVQWKRKDSSPFWVQLNWHAVKRSDGATEYFEGFVRDITEERRAKEALRESEERYRELFDNAKDAIYVHDLSGRYVSLNRAAEKLAGYSRNEIIGKHFSNFVAPRDLKHVRKNLCKKLDDEGETTYEIDLVTKDRRRVPVEVISRLIYENGQPVGVQGTARDMTERRRAQEALRIYSRRLIEAQEAERQSLARELHDEIGQVLTAVRINLQRVQNACQIEVCLPYVEESIVVVDEALTRIRELSLELRPSLLDDLGLAAALRWYVDRYGQRTGIVAEVQNGFEERGRLPRELETECFRIAQEALTNVARHAQATRVSVQLEGDQERLVLTITDNGIGFDTDSLLRTGSSASTLGLRGMKERALAMNGHIEIESSPGKGTHIRASFPLKRRN